MTSVIICHFLSQPVTSVTCHIMSRLPLLLLLAVVVGIVTDDADDVVCCCCVVAAHNRAAAKTALMQSLKKNIEPSTARNNKQWVLVWVRMAVLLSQ